MLEPLGILVGLVAHIGHDAQTELLGFLTLAVMLAHKGYQTLGQAYEADSEGALVDDALDGVIVLKVLAAHPEGAHKQRELLL